ncbi:MAG: hypothetical protein LBP85_00945 [Prevotellaceae bacterium]|jgi:hypothetical protein|nr:hypothetical protein [Prevotellaceae bacterium]
MKNDKYIFKPKQLLFTTITIVLFCASCIRDEFNPDIDATEDIVIANEIETCIKITGLICREVEIISEKMQMGQAIGVIINEERNEWEYNFNTDLLSGKIVVEHSGQNIDGNGIKKVDCAKLKIHYYENIWLLLFGSFTIENIGTSSKSKKYKVKTSEFGYMDAEKSKVPNIATNSDYVADYNFDQENVPAKIVFSGSSYGKNQLSGNYKQSITKNIEIEMSELQILNGKMNISIDKYGKAFPIEVEYSKQGRTVTCKGKKQTTYYNN